MPNENPLNSTIEQLTKLKEKANESAENSEDVKAGKCTPEDEKNEPSYRLYNAIVDTSVSIMQTDDVVRIYENIANKFGPDITKDLVQLFAICMTHSAYQAVLFYDDLLKEELQKQFDHMINGINNIGAEAYAHRGAIENHMKRIQSMEGSVEVFKKKIGDLENKMIIHFGDKPNG